MVDRWMEPLERWCCKINSGCCRSIKSVDRFVVVVVADRVVVDDGLCCCCRSIAMVDRSVVAEATAVELVLGSTATISSEGESTKL